MQMAGKSISIDAVVCAVLENNKSQLFSVGQSLGWESDTAYLSHETFLLQW